MRSGIPGISARRFRRAPPSAASFAGDSVKEWNLGPDDAFEVARFSGRTGQPNLYVHNPDWFGVFNERRGYSLDRIDRWIHDSRYRRNS